MLIKIEILILSLAGIFMTGCISTKSYVDPQFRKATYADIDRVNTGYKANIEIEFQRNGKHIHQLDNELRGHVERTFRATGVIIPTYEPVGLKIKVIANNIADMGLAATKGFGTGLTFGAVGTSVTDFYEFTIEYQQNGMRGNYAYKHAIHSTTGNKEAPVPVEPTINAFEKVVEDIILNFIKNMQQSNELSYMLRGDPEHTEVSFSKL